MRDLKFRGIDIKTNKFVFGDLVRLVIGGNIKHYIKPLDDKRVEVDPETIGQYLGPINKSIIGIYEGDVLKIHKDDKYVSRGRGRTAKKVPVYRNYIVQFNQEKMGFEFKCLSKKPNYLETGTNKIERIGNIHQNPELLNKQTNEHRN